MNAALASISNGKTILLTTYIKSPLSNSGISGHTSYGVDASVMSLA